MKGLKLILLINLIKKIIVISANTNDAKKINMTLKSR